MCTRVCVYVCAYVSVGVGVRVRACARVRVRVRVHIQTYTHLPAPNANLESAAGLRPWGESPALLWPSKCAECAGDTVGGGDEPPEMKSAEVKDFISDSVLRVTVILRPSPLQMIYSGAFPAVFALTQLQSLNCRPTN